MHDDGKPIFETTDEGAVVRKSDEGDKVNDDGTINSDTSWIQTGNSDHEHRSKDDEQLLEENVETSVAHVLFERLVQETSDVVGQQDTLIPRSDDEISFVINTFRKLSFEFCGRGSDEFEEEIQG